MNAKQRQLRHQDYVDHILNATQQVGIYVETNLDLVWQTVQVFLPKLERKLKRATHDGAETTEAKT